VLHSAAARTSSETVAARSSRGGTRQRPARISVLVGPCARIIAKYSPTISAEIISRPNSKRRRGGSSAGHMAAYTWTAAIASKYAVAATSTPASAGHQLSCGIRE
jgi:hypothetical protein